MQIMFPHSYKRTFQNETDMRSYANVVETATISLDQYIHKLKTKVSIDTSVNKNDNFF